MISQIISAFLTVSLIYPICSVLYNLYLHPLRKYPGPKSWAASRLVFIRSLWAGNLLHDVWKIHEEYGPVVRIAPDEISFSEAYAWQDIYASRPGQAAFPKNPVWWSAPPGQPDSLITIKNDKQHARMRRLLDHGFTEAAVREQEDIVQTYVHKLIERLSILAKDKPEQAIDIVQWLNFTTFDIVGDLGFGESFDCLEKSQYHPWVALIFNHFKATSYVASARYYPLIDKLLMSLLPKSVMKIQRDHFQQVVDKVHRRLNFEVQRPDFMSHIIRHNDHQEKEHCMSIPEIEATFNIITIAGSETTATVLSGTLNYLTRNPESMKKLVKEIIGNIQQESEITFQKLRNLHYLNAVLNEGMRMCPPIPAGLPRIVPPTGGSVGRHYLPGGTGVSVHAWSLYRNPKTFTHPLDFVPERWLSSAREPSSPYANDQLHAVQPFSLGPRHCIGKNLAWAEMRLILAQLLWNFEITSAEAGGKSNPVWEDQKTYMLVEKLPLYLKLKPRRVHA